MPKLPEKVKIGYRTYKITSWPAVEANSAGRYAQVSHLVKEIKVDESHGSIQTGESLLYEIIHAVFTIFYREEDEKEEGTVQKASNGLATVWVDNPEVMKFIADCFAEGT